MPFPHPPPRIYKGYHRITRHYVIVIQNKLNSFNKPCYIPKKGRGNENTRDANTSVPMPPTQPSFDEPTNAR